MISSRIISPTGRIVFGLVGLTVSIILLAAFVGVLPNHREDLTRSRRQLCESLAMSFSALANKSDVSSVQKHFASIVERNDEILTVGLRREDGSRLMEVGPHFDSWPITDSDQSTESAISIPIFGNGNLWGAIEVQFQPIADSKFGWFSSRPEIALAIFVAVIGLLAFYFYLSIVLRQLNPSKVIPGRVREALDTLAEGLLVLDKEKRIVLANQAFQNSTGRSMADLIGKQAQSLPFFSREEIEGGKRKDNPWDRTLESGEQVRGSIIGIEKGDNDATTYSVSCAPILDDKGNNRGVLASFEDVTQLERKKNELKEMVFQLDASTEEIKRQNKELEILATRDALTGCMNRRSFFQEFDHEFSIAKKHGQPLSAFMVDIDHFKSINDNHGHATGDVVLQKVAETLESSVRDSDIVCRYGGEEFSILLPHTRIEHAVVVAEKVRTAIEELVFEELSITASLGVSSVCQGPSTPQDLLEQADKCLYVAKRNGRNQVIRFDQVPDDIEIDESKISRTREEETEDSRIPFHAVTALISALAFRDQETANHCRRVADMCVAVAEGMLPMRECYTLEIAGLLHDIGKIGVPDAILLKPNALSDEEWNVMKMHERIGVELVKTTFGCQELDEIVANYRHSFRESKDRKLPIGSRILAIVDAWDSMTTDKAYRKGMSTNEAKAELRRCAGEQFDPELVERVISTIQVRGNELSPTQEQISKAAALSIGLQIERLSEALDQRDIGGIAAIANRLKNTALKHGATTVAEKAQIIASVPPTEGALFEVLQNTNELLDLCRSTQRTLLDPLESETSESKTNH